VKNKDVLYFQDGRFSELAKAMQQSGFVNRLHDLQQPCTILAPSDEAFQKIPQSRLDRILKDKHAREGSTTCSGMLHQITYRSFPLF
jgi:uncharacterized surface protein with fasciclin (FAS1) repeats